MPLRVDIATGETRMHRTDVRLPGFIPLTLKRTYRSGRQADGAFGAHWRLNLDRTLRIESEHIVFAPDTDQETTFSRVEEGMQVRHAAGALVQHRPEAYAVVPSPARRLVFEKENARDGAVIPLSRIEDGRGNDVHFFFDAGRLVGIVDTVGRRIQFDYRGGRVERIELANGASSTLRTFRYDARGDLVRETDANGESTSFGYQDHLMVESVNRCGGAQYAQYDEDRRCRALWYGDGSHARRFAYDEARSSARVMGATGEQTLYRHAPTGEVIERIDPADQSQHFYYDEASRLIGFSDERETVQTLQQLDVDEGLFTCVDGEERAAYLEVDESLRLAAVTDADDQQATLQYNGHNRPKALRTETEAVWTFERDERGAVERVQSPSGRHVQFRWHSDAQTLVVEDEVGQLVEDHFDEYGRLVERSDELGRRFQWRYDPAGRLKSVRVASQSLAFQYDPEGNLTQVDEASGRVSTFRHDALGRLQECALGERTFDFGYDASGFVRTIQDEDGRTVRYNFDRQGRLARAVHSDGHETTFDVEDDGTLVTVQEDEGETRTRFNWLGDPVEWHTPDGPVYQCAYGPTGALRFAERGEESLSFGYRDDGLLRSAQTSGLDLTFGYDADGRLETVATEKQPLVGCERDARGRISSLTVRSRSIALEYDAGNRVETIQAGEETYTVQYDVLDHPVEGRGGGLDSIPRDGVVEVPLLEASERAGPAAEITLHASNSGIALSAHVGDACIPLWGRGSYVTPVLPMSSGLRAASIVRGSGPLNELLVPSPSFDCRGEWQNLIGCGIRQDHTEIPRPSDVQRPSSAGLDRFFLQRPFYALGDRSLAPGEAADGRADVQRSPDPWTTGRHVSSPLRPPIWTGRTAGRFLYHRAMGMTPGPKAPFDLLRALLQTS